MYERITLDNLIRYDSKLKGWLGGRLAPAGSTAPMALTEKAGAVTCWPVGGTPLAPVVDYIFTEEPPANGQPKAPDNPSTITGVSSVKVTRCGKNLLHYPYNANSLSANGLTITVNQDGTVSIKGTCTYVTFFSVCDCPSGDAYASEYIRLFDDKSYTMSLGVASGSLSGGDVVIQCMKAGSGLGTNNVSAGSSAVINKSSGNYASYMRYCLRIASGTVCTDLVVAPQVEEGTVATSFEPYSGDNYTISLGNTYYGGSIDLATGVMTVTWRGENMNAFYDVHSIGTNTVALNYYTTKTHKGDIGSISSYLACNKFQPLNGSSDEEHCRFGGEPNNANYLIRFYIDKNRLDVSGAVDPSSPTNAEWLAAADSWLTSNPVFVCYQLFTPETIQLTPVSISALPQQDKYTPRINTLYSDAESIQVGYLKSPIRDEFEKTQAIIAQGGEV